jgi:hypothetical protein
VERIEQSRLKQEQAGQARCCARRERPRDFGTRRNTPVAIKDAIGLMLRRTRTELIERIERDSSPDTAGKPQQCVVELF